MVEQDPHDGPDIHDSFLALPVMGYDLPKETTWGIKCSTRSQPTARPTAHLHPTLDPTRSQCRFLHTNTEGPVSILLRNGSLGRHLSGLWNYQKTDERSSLPTNLVYAADSTASVTNERRLHRLAPVPDTKKISQCRRRIARRYTTNTASSTPLAPLSSCSTDGHTLELATHSTHMAGFLGPQDPPQSKDRMVAPATEFTIH